MADIHELTVEELCRVSSVGVNAVLSGGFYAIPSTGFRLALGALRPSMLGQPSTLVAVSAAGPNMALVLGGVVTTKSPGPCVQEVRARRRCHGSRDLIAALG